MYDQPLQAASVAKHKLCTTIALTMSSRSIWQITIPPGQEAVLARFGLDATHAFDDPRIRVWRDLPERQNAYLDGLTGQNGASRLHVKRYKPPHGPEAAAEARAIGLLLEHDIPTVPLVAWGTCRMGEDSC